MVQFSHVAATIQGVYKSTDYWGGEFAQTGIRIACWPANVSPSLDAPLPIRDCSVTYDEIDTGLFQGIMGWDAEGEYWDKGDQVDIATALHTWANAIKAQIYSGFQFTNVKISPITPAGRLANTSTFINFKTPIVGGASAQLPPQNSVAASFRSNVPGRRGRGRMYIPAVNASAVATTGTLGSTARNTFGNATSDLMGAVGQVGGLGVQYKLVITSAGNERYILPTQVRVGDQVDTQRRRRNGIRETYSTY